MTDYILIKTDTIKCLLRYVKNYFKYIVVLILFPVPAYSQIMNNTVTVKEHFLTIGVNSDNYLGFNFKPSERLSLFVDHTFFIERMKYQLFDFGVKKSILKKSNFDFNIQTSLFGSYVRSNPLCYLSPEVVFNNKLFRLVLKFDLHGEFFQRT